MTTTDQKQGRLVQLLYIIEDAVRDAREAAQHGNMASVRENLGDVPEYVSGCVNISKIIEREIAARGK